jgi:predicted anti-sigma-YlaC factor YlaD
MLTCKELTELATDYLEGDLGFIRRLAIRLHLAMCKHCPTYLRQIELTIQLLRQLPAEPVSPVMNETLLGQFRARSNKG